MSRERKQVKARTADPAPPARTKRAPGKATFRELIESAIAIWGESGVAAVSMNAVAARAGRARRTVYHHFADRADLLLAVRTHLDEAFAGMFAAGEQHEGNPFEAFPSFSAENPELVRFYLRGLLDRDFEEDPLLRAGLAFQRNMAQAGKIVKGMDVDHVAFTVFGMWYAAHLAVSQGHTLEERREHARRFAITFERIMSTVLAL